MERVLTLVALSILSLTLIPITGAPAHAFQDPSAECLAPDNGNGSADLPGPCPFVPEQGQMHISEGLPPGSEILITPTVDSFFDITYSVGGDLNGGKIEWDATVTMQMTGTGLLAGYNRLIPLPVHMEIETGPRHPGDAVQTFPNEMVQLQGQIFGDPDFQSLQLTSGRDFILPGAGHTTLTQVPGGNWNVDSFFDIEYRIDFVGAPGSILEGMGGATTDSIRLRQGEPSPPPGICEAPDNGTGTVSLPAQCPLVQVDTAFVLTEGIGGGGSLIIYPVIDQFFDVDYNFVASRNVEVQDFKGTMRLHMEGTGPLSGFARDIQVPVAMVTETGPRTPGEAVQTFPNDMVILQGEIFGDPDFDLLRVRGGSGFGMPSPGHTTLTEIPSGNWNVDSFFDIMYRIEFQGAPGSVLEGMGGAQVGRHDFRTGTPSPADPGECRVADNGKATVEYPPPCPLRSGGDHQPQLDVLGGKKLNNDFVVDSFFDITYSIGGSSGTDTARWDASLRLALAGTDSLAGYYRYITIPVTLEVVVHPPEPGQPVQDFDTEMMQLQGEIFGDPDFDILRIRAGSGFGLPSPGHTTLTRLPGGNFQVDSFFDIFYEIHYEGNPGGAFGADSGTTVDSTVLRSGRPGPRPVAIVPDNGSGVPDLIPDIPFVGENGTVDIRDGLPPGAEVKSRFTVDSFFDIFYEVGGSLGGGIYTDGGTAHMTMSGIGALGGFQRTLALPTHIEWVAGPIDTSKKPISFPTAIDSLFAEITGDPDFDLLRIKCGTVFGLPSPGHTTLTSLPNDNWNVDSFFDITYTIEFVGAPGGALDGLSGTTTDSIRIRQGVPVLPPPLPHFGGINHYPLGGAKLEVNPDGHLVVSNIGSSGDDGVSIELPEDSTYDNGMHGFSLRFDSTTTLDSSGFIEYRLVGGPQGGDSAAPSEDYFSIRVGNYNVDSFFDIWTEVSYLPQHQLHVTVYNSNIKVAEALGGVGDAGRISRLPIVIRALDKKNPVLSMEFSNLTLIEFGSLSGTGTRIDIECKPYAWPKAEPRIPFTAEEGFTGMQVLAGNIPELVIEEENMVPENVSQGVAHLAGWNMLSNPAWQDPGEDSVHLVYPDNIFPHVFGFNPGSGYVQSLVVTPGAGYWGKYSSAGVTQVTGTFFSTDTVEVVPGWQMVGALSNAVPASSVGTDPPGIISSYWFGYDGGYQTSSTIEPGKSYWVKAADTGKIFLNFIPAATPKSTAGRGDPADLLHSMTVADAAGNQGELYFGVDTEGLLDRALTVMPPLPPAGVFDARWKFDGEDRYAVVHGAVSDEPVSATVELRAAVFPVTLAWNLKNDGVAYELRVPGLAPRRMSTEGSLRLTDPGVTRVEIVAISGPGIPAEYALSQNYPNPFNPTTKILFEMPVSGVVSIHIFDILGRNIRTLLGETLPAGYHNAVWNGMNGDGHSAPSGVYFLKLAISGQDGSAFTSVKKLMLMR